MDENYDVKILMIDDEKSNLEKLESKLKLYGYTNLHQASSKEEAEKKFKNREHFDILIIDLDMEEGDSGLKLIEQHKELASIVIIFTAHDDMELCRRAFKDGVWDYIYKKSKDYDSFEELDSSIQKGIDFIKKFGNGKDVSWISKKGDNLVDDYYMQYIAVVDGKVIESAETEEELQELLIKHNRPKLTTVTTRILG